MIFCGVIATKDSMPKFWVFLYRCTPLTYLTSAMMSIGLGDSFVKCAPTEILTFPPQTPGVQNVRIIWEPILVLLVVIY